VSVLIRRKKKRSLLGTIVKGVIGVIVLWLLIAATVPFFEHWVWFRFVLVCALGLGFLAITYILRTC
jgi:hypothetical protein